MAKDRLLKIKTNPEDLAKGLSNLIKAKLEKAENIPNLTKKEGKTYKAGETVEWEIEKQEEEEKDEEREKLANEWKKALRNKDKEKVREIYIKSAGIKEPDEFEQAKQRVLDSINKNTEEKFKDFDEKIDAAYNRTEKVVKEAGEKFNKQIEDLKNKIDNGFEGPDTKEEKSLDEKLKEIELNRKNKLENGPLPTRLKQGIIKGLEKWENWGKNEKGTSGYAKRFTKMAINLSLIGAISSVSVDQLSKMGIGTASALSGGVTSYIGRKIAVGLGIGGIMELGGKKIPEKLKKALPYIMIAGTVGLSIATGGVGGLAVGLSSVAGLAASKLVKGKFSEEKIAKKQEEATQKLLEKSTGIIDENRLKEIENEYSKILKKYENQRIWGKLLDGAKKLGVGALVSTVSLEASSFSQDLHQHAQTNEENIKHEEQVGEAPKNEHGTPTIEKVSAEQKEGEGNIKTETEKTDETAKKEQTNENHKTGTEETTSSIKVSSKGFIKTFDDVKAEISKHYNNDFSKAPQSIQDFMKISSTEEAINTGTFAPGSEAESGVVGAGSTIEIDYNTGAVTIHDINGTDHTLIDGSNKIHEWDGKMFDSDKNIDHTHDVPDNQNEYVTPEQVNPVTGELIDQNNPSENVVSEQINPVTGEVIDQNNTINPEETGENTYGLTPEQIAEVKQVNEENINHLFGDKTTFMQDNVLNSENLTADKMIHLNIEGMTDETKKLVSYLNKLHEITGLNPTEATLINSAETNNEYIERALLKAEEMGLLDKIKL